MLLKVCRFVLFNQQNYRKNGLNLILKSFILGLIKEDVWLGAKFSVDQLEKKTSTSNPETWENYNGWSSWRNGITPARGIGNERRLLMKGDSNNLGDWVVWNGNEKKGIVCQYKKNGKLDIYCSTIFLRLTLCFSLQARLG